MPPPRTTPQLQVGRGLAFRDTNSYPEGPAGDGGAQRQQLGRGAMLRCRRGQLLR